MKNTSYNSSTSIIRSKLNRIKYDARSHHWRLVISMRQRNENLKAVTTNATDTSSFHDYYSYYDLLTISHDTDMNFVHSQTESEIEIDGEVSWWKQHQ